MNIPKNKLWVYPTNNENFRKAREFPHFSANSDHILIISDTKPEGAVEVTEKLRGYLGLSDWQWIYAESEKIRREQEEMYKDEIAAAQNEFLKDFRIELEKARREAEHGEKENAGINTAYGETE